MQKAYLMSLYELAEKDSNVLLCLADSGTSYDELLKKQFPDQVLDFGIAEENMVAAAAGLASCGKIPFVYTASAFLSYRSLEFIRDDVCFQNKNVKFIGMGAGLAWSTLGPTHHTTEELSILRVMPNLIVLSPSCPTLTSKCVKFAYNYKGPVYIRIGMGGEEELYDNDFDCDILKNRILSNGSDVAIFSTGTLTAEVKKSLDLLKQKGINATLIDICSIVPFDKQCVIDIAKQKNKIVSVEEHSITGGIGSCIVEVLADNELSTKFLRIGLNNTFAKGYGTLDDENKTI